MASQPTSKAELLDRIQRAWDDFNAYLNSLTGEQLTALTDAAGWTVKDHLLHLAVWEEGVYALLQRRDRAAAMGLDKETFESGDFDRMNAVIQRRYQDLPLEESLRKFHDVHQRLLENIQSLSEEDLVRPYRDYAPDSTSDRPVYAVISGNTFGHYEEHRPWIEAIVNKG